MENTWVLEDAAGLEMLSSRVVAMRAINYNVHRFLLLAAKIILVQNTTQIERGRPENEPISILVISYLNTKY